MADDRVITLTDFCKVAGVSIATLRRLIKSGEAPPITWLSTRRCGIRVRHGREWLDARTTSAAA
jgi:predicted DNA-binding transcriptional regulator AlpA